MLLYYRVLNINSKYWIFYIKNLNIIKYKMNIYRFQEKKQLNFINYLLKKKKNIYTYRFLKRKYIKKYYIKNIIQNSNDFNIFFNLNNYKLFKTLIREKKNKKKLYNIMHTSNRLNYKNILSEKFNFKNVKKKKL